MVKRKYIVPVLAFLLVLGLVILNNLNGYLINQIPPLSDLPIVADWLQLKGKDPIDTGMRIGRVTLVAGVFAWGLGWAATEIWTLSQPKTTIVTELDSGQRRRLIQSQLEIVERRLADMLERSVLIPLGFEDAGQQLGEGRSPLEILQRADDVAPVGGWFGRVKEWIPFGRGGKVMFPARARMIDVFRHPDVSGRLLILGSPGAGKTTTLLELARELMTEAKADESKPWPHLFEMAGWVEGRSLGDYLAAEMKRLSKEKLNEAVCQRLLESGRVLPLLDGLDELRDLNRIQAGMAAINEFLGDAYGHRDAVVCCRIRDYGLAQGQLTALNGAVQLQPLTDGAIRAHLQALGKGQLWAVIQQNPALLEADVQDGDLVMPPLLRTPLFLSIFATVNPTEAINGLAELWDGYIVQRLGIPAELLSGKGYKRYQSGEVPSQKQTRYHLVFLAKQLVRSNPEFLIEAMQPSWLTTRQKWKMRLVFSLVEVLIFSLIVSLMCSQIGGTISSLIFGLILSLIGGVMVGMMGVVVQLEPTEKILISTSHLAQQKFFEKLILSLSPALIFGLISGLILGLVLDVISGLIWGLTFGLILGLIPVLIQVCTMTIEVKSEPNQSIKASAKNMAILILIVLILCEVIQIKMMPYLPEYQFQHFPLMIAISAVLLVFIGSPRIAVK
ncbi:MAG: hypothetical protein RLZZ511_4269 [Cyanobacteriota bacterium]|jgi:DNA polymerase III delta prime subunit/F0F1-type ATP synthase assembly protein I